MTLDKMQIWAFFFNSSSKWVVKKQGNNSQHQQGNLELLTTYMQWLFKKFCKGYESLEGEEHTGWPTTNWESLSKLILQPHEKLSKDSTLTILQLCGIWCKLERWKSSVSGGLTSWPQIKKIIVLKCHLLLFSNNELFLDWIVTHNKKSTVYDNHWQPALWMDWEEAPKHFPKPNSHQKKVMVTVWWSAAGLIHHSFLSPGETITCEKYAQQIGEMHGQLQHLRWPWSTERAPFFSMTMPDHISQPMLQKLNKLDHQVLLHLPDSPDLSPTDYHFFKHLDNFLQGKCFHNEQDAENSFQEFIEFQSTYFYAIGINKLISHWQKCLYCNGFYFD